VPPAQEIWLLTRPQDRKDLRIVTVADYLQSTFERERALFVD
jgi:hypothetical protein